MAYNRMTYTIDSSMQFPLVEIDLDMGSLSFYKKAVWFTTHRQSA